MKKIITVALLLTMVYFSAITGYALPIESSSNLTTKENKNIIIDTRKNIVNLELCEGEVVFSDQREISLIAKEYGLGDANQIDEIRYVPIVEASEILKENEEAQTSSLANEGTVKLMKNGASTSYYIKKKSYSDKRGGTIRSSWYRYPGGTMTVSKSIARTYSFSANAGISVKKSIVTATLSSGYNFSVTSSDTVSDSQNVSVKAKHKRNVTAYVNKRVYKGELWKKWLRKGEWVNTKCGNTTVNRAVGVIFVIGKNVKV